MNYKFSIIKTEDSTSDHITDINNDRNIILFDSGDIKSDNILTNHVPTDILNISKEHLEILKSKGEVTYTFLTKTTVKIKQENT